jgi:hypothetical protein
LTQFPQPVTPNFHAMATNFVDFDNFYDSGSASMEGWQWSTAARALDLNEKSQVVNYGKGGSNYDSEGTARSINVGVTSVAADGPDGEQGAGYVWDAVLRAHKSIRNYEVLS